MLLDPAGQGAMLYLLLTHKSYRQPAFKILFLAAQMCYLFPAEILIMDVTCIDSFPSLMPPDLTLKISDSGVNPILSNLNVAYAIQPHEISFLASVQGETTLFSFSWTEL